MKKLLIIATVFYYGDMVRYPVPKFYSKVCSGRGEVIDYKKFGKEDVYLVKPSDVGCAKGTDFYRASELKPN